MRRTIARASKPRRRKDISLSVIDRRSRRKSKRVPARGGLRGGAGVLLKAFAAGKRQRGERQNRRRGGKYSAAFTAKGGKREKALRIHKTSASKKENVQFCHIKRLP